VVPNLYHTKGKNDRFCQDLLRKIVEDGYFAGCFLARSVSVILNIEEPMLLSRGSEVNKIADYSPNHQTYQWDEGKGRVATEIGFMMEDQPAGKLA